MLDAHVRAQIALLAPEHIFVHAGAVALGDRAVLMPGFTFAGKTTLTHALVAAGATYLSALKGAVATARAWRASAARPTSRGARDARHGLLSSTRGRQKADGAARGPIGAEGLG